MKVLFYRKIILKKCTFDLHLCNFFLFLQAKISFSILD